MKKDDFERLHKKNINSDINLSIKQLQDIFTDILTYDSLNKFIDENDISIPLHIKMYLDHCSICSLLLKNKLIREKKDER